MPLPKGGVWESNSYIICGGIKERNTSMTPMAGMKTCIMMGVELDKESMFKFIYRLALDKLLDKDKMFNVRTYFHIDS